MGTGKPCDVVTPEVTRCSALGKLQGDSRDSPLGGLSLPSRPFLLIGGYPVTTPAMARPRAIRQRLGGGH